MQDCILFTGYKNRHGYGVKRVGSRTFLAHRLAYEAANGPIPEGNVVRHMCHNPACVNPEHLKVGTQRDNVMDMIEAGRKASTQGSLHGRAVLTEEVVKEIYLMTGKTQLEIATMYGISRSHVSNIRGGRMWHHVTSTLENTP